MGTNGSFDDRNVLGMLQTAFTEVFAGSWANRLSLYNGASDRAVETYGILGANPAMRKWVGARQNQVLDKKSYEIRNDAYESTLVIPDTDLRRDKLGMLQTRINSFAQDAAAGHWETLLTDLMNNATSNYCYDGVVFTSASHSWGSSGTQKNLLGATECPSSNVSTTTAPTPLEAANVILEMTAHALTIKNNQGRPVNGNARNFAVIVATAPMFSAVTQAIANNLLSGYVSNPLTGMQTGGFRYEPILLPDLTSSTETIRLARLDGPVRPFILQEEQGVEFAMKGQDSDFHFDNKAIAIGVDASRGAGYGAWEYFFTCVLT